MCSKSNNELLEESSSNDNNNDYDIYDSEVIYEIGLRGKSPSILKSGVGINCVFSSISTYYLRTAIKILL